jgi:hypothetical protein
MSDFARSTNSRKNLGVPPLHPGFTDRTDTTIGAPPRDNNPPDASSPLPTDHEKQHGNKTFPAPGITYGMTSRDDRGSYDPTMAHKVMSEAVVSGSTQLPAKNKEN